MVVKKDFIPLKRELRILSCSALRMTHRLVATNAARCVQYAVALSLRRCGCPVDTSARQKHRPSRQARRKATAAIRFFPFKIIKSSCARAARAPYFCPYRNRGKNRRTPYGLGFRTFPNDQRDKLPFGNLYCIEIRYVLVNNVAKKLRYPVIASAAMCADRLSLTCHCETV